MAAKRALASSKVHWLLIYVAGISWLTRLSTWSFMREMSGEMTRVTPGIIKAGSWKQIDFPAPVGMMARQSLPSRRVWMTSCWPGRNDV